VVRAAARGGGAPLREQEKVLVTHRTRAGLRANELQEVRQRRYLQSPFGY
jgi:hypothetical protein